ncbi:MAG: hypothetical protein R2795_08930 [Saprospiraceae bacterium]
MVRGVPKLISVNDLAGDVMDADFRRCEDGDVNGSARQTLSGDDRTLNGQFNFNVANESLKAGNVYVILHRNRDGICRRLPRHFGTEWCSWLTSEVRCSHGRTSVLASLVKA